MRQNVDEVGHLSGTLLAISLACLRLACVRVVLGGHHLVVDGVLEGVGVKTTVAAPGVMVAIEKLLNGKLLHLVILEVDVTSNSISCGVGP